MQVIAGIVDIKAPVETNAQIEERIREVLKYVAADRLWIAPSCGLGRRTTDIALGKVSRMVAVAQHC